MENAKNEPKNLGQQLFELRHNGSELTFYIAWAMTLVFALTLAAMFLHPHDTRSVIDLPTFLSVSVGLWIVGIGPWHLFCGRTYSRAVKWSRFLEITVDDFLPFLMVGILIVVSERDGLGMTARNILIIALTTAALVVVRKTMTKPLMAYHDKKFGVK